MAEVGVSRQGSPRERNCYCSKLRTGFADDSPLEESGFEHSVPEPNLVEKALDTPSASTPTPRLK